MQKQKNIPTVISCLMKHISLPYKLISAKTILRIFSGILFTLSPLFPFTLPHEDRLPAFAVQRPEYDRISPLFFRTYTTAFNFQETIELFYNYGIIFLNSSGNFAAPDNLNFSLMGGSWQWNKFYDEEFNITDPVFAGTPLHPLSFLGKSYKLNPQLHEIKGESRSFDKNIVRTEFTTADTPLDGTAFGKAIHEAVYPFEEHSTRRNPEVGKERQRTLYHAAIRSSFTIDNKKWGQRRIRAHLIRGEREFPDFDEDGDITNAFKENYSQISLSADFDFLKHLSPIKSLRFKYTHLSRSRLFAEWGHNASETASLSSDSATLFTKIAQGSFGLTAGLSIGAKSIRHNVRNFSRNIVDQNGEGYEPWYADRDIYHIQQNNAMGLGFSIPFFDRSGLRFEFDNAFIFTRPTEKTQQHAVYYKYRQTVKSLYLYQADSSDDFRFIGRGDLGVYFEKKIFNNTLRLDLSALYNTILLSKPFKKSIFLPSFDFSLDIEALKTPLVDISIIGGKKGLPLAADLDQFLSDNSLAGTYYYWNDLNSDLSYDDSEKGDIYKTSGGKYHDTANNLRAPYQIYLDIPIRFKFGSSFYITHRISGKSYRDLLWVTKQNSSESGTRKTLTNEFGTVTPDSGAYFHNGGETRYLLQNMPHDLFPTGNLFLNAPFYAGTTLTLSFLKPRFFISLSFTAFMIVGPAVTENGNRVNTPGAVSELQADPNNAYKQIGRYPNDRGYTGKLYFGIRPTRSMLAAVSLRYRDGEPFTYKNVWLDTDTNGNTQAAIQKRGVFGDNIYDGDFGTRKTAVWNLDLLYAWEFSIARRKFGISFKIHNLIDLAEALTEKVFNNGGRVALQVQSPIGFEFHIFHRF